MNWKIRRQAFSWETSSNDVELKKLRELREESFQIEEVVNGDTPWSHVVAAKLRELQKEEGIYEYASEEGILTLKRVEKAGYFSFKFNPQLIQRSEEENSEGDKAATKKNESEEIGSLG